MHKLTLPLKIILISALAILSGCATTHQVDGVNDPYESYNRTMYSFNKTLDKAIIKPAAQVYDAVLPDPISWGISNFFSNLLEVKVVLNDLLQFKFEQAADDFGRLALNTTVGFGGIFDIAGHAGHTANDEDFGQTLGVWGVEPGPYLVLPLFGPRNIRDTVGLVGDTYSHPVTYLKDAGARNAFVTANLLDKRATALGIDNVLNEATADEYSYVRDAYTQRRLNLVYDGNPPEEDFDVFSD
ncbi:VacJ family lipoprotein [Pseudomonadota bacterium]|nr:VacJ family lipoprotein [Pseudomonadota bacterium]